MNIHNHSIWPPPDVSDLNAPANAVRYGALPQQPACVALIVLVGHFPDDSSFPVINLMD